MKFNKKILICFNQPIGLYDNYLGKQTNSPETLLDLSETDFCEELDAISSILRKRYKEIKLLSVNSNTVELIDEIYKYAPDVIFNFVESIDGNAQYECYVTGLFDILNVPYTGNSTLSLGSCLSKVRTKQILVGNDIPTPKFIIADLNSRLNEDSFQLQYPVITKLVSEDASIGISENSVVKNIKELNRQLAFLYKTYNQAVLIEEYIFGRELNVAIFNEEILPISEIIFDKLPAGLPPIVTYESKWSAESIYFKNTDAICPAILSRNIKASIEKVAYKAYKALDCRDYVRVDIRLSRNNIPYVIEVNPNPAIAPDSGFMRSANAAGYSYSNVIYNLAEAAFERTSYD